MKKFALVSHVLPPVWSGQSVILHRLLKDLAPEQYCLISKADHSPESVGPEQLPRLPGNYYYLPAEPTVNRGHRFGMKPVCDRVNTAIAIATRGKRIAEIVKREKCEAVVACSGDLVDLPAANLAARLTRLPFYPYFFDYYGHQFIDPWVRRQARFLEPFVLRRARKVIVPNETLADELKQRYGKESAVIHNPSDLSRYEAAEIVPSARSDDKLRIVFTGALYDAHFDAFRNLLNALSLLNRADLELHIYTAVPLEYLRSNGICGSITFHEHLPNTEMPRIQRSADILFLPLAFASPYPEIIRTSAPGKIGEYLASKRPILVHAPSDCHLTWYFRRYDCGAVVDVLDPRVLADMIERLLNDAEYRKQITARAWERAHVDFDIGIAQRSFAELLSSGR